MIRSKKELQFKYLGMPFSKLEEICGNIDKYYYSFDIPKEDELGRPKTVNGVVQKRTINASRGVLEELQKKILQKILEPNFLMPIHVQGGVKGKDNISHARVHQGRKFRFATDIKSFYPSISEDRIKGKLLGLGFSKPIAWALTSLTTYRGELAQGVCTSTFLANLVFLDTDMEILEYISGHDIKYSRWVDDLHFSSPQDFQELTNGIVEVITKDGFAVSRKKTTYRSKKSAITGVLVGNNGLNVTEKFRNKGLLDLTEDQKMGRENYYDRVKSNKREKK